MIAKNQLPILACCLLICGHVLAQGITTNDCYQKKSGGKILIGNSKVELSIDTANGAIVGLLNKTSGTEYLQQGTPDIFHLQYASYENNGAVSKNPWTAGYGSHIFGNKQTLSATSFEATAGGAVFSATYSNLDLGRRTVPVSITYSIALKAADEETTWQISIDNKDPGTIREVRFPVLGGLAKKDYLIMPNHGGHRITDPISKLSDETPEIYLEYPARASMQWFDYYSPDNGLYMASYDKGQAYTRMYFGRQPNERGSAAMWFVKYPFVITGQRWQSPHIAVGPHAADWHWGADHYRNWIESWVPKPNPPKRIQEMIAGADDFFIKDAAEKTVNTFEDLVAKSSAMGAGKMFSYPLLVGWALNGHDTYYPEYAANKTLGGDSALIGAIRKTQSKGIKVDAYINGRINNIETETYKQFGKKWAVHGMAPGLSVGSIHFFELQEHWNQSWQHAKNNGGWFATMCPSARGWQDHIVGQVLRAVGTYRFDGVFLDQPGSFFAELCYNPFHDHTTPATAWGPGYLQIFKRIYTEGKKLNPHFALWTEGMNDVYSQYIDYHTDKNPVWLPMREHPETETFAEMWRYTLPWCITLNDAGKYDYAPSKDKIYGDMYRFVMGIRGVAHDFDNRWQQSKADSLEHDFVVKKIEKLWTKGKEFFFYGRFKDDVGIRVSDTAAFAKVYTTPNAIAIPVWNTTGKSLRVDLSVDRSQLLPAGKGAKGATDLETGKRIPFTTNGNTLHLHLPPHGVSVVVLR